MNKLEKLYAKLICRFSRDKRVTIWRKLVSLLKNDFTLVDALNRIQMIESKGGAKPNEPFAIAMREIQKNLERGMTFAEATSGWVPSEETLLLTSGNMSSLVISLENVSRVVNGVSRIKRAMTSALAYPLFLLVLTIGIIVMVGVYLGPPLTEAAGSNIVWHGSARSLIWASDFANEYEESWLSPKVWKALIDCHMPVWYFNQYDEINEWPNNLINVEDALKLDASPTVSLDFVEHAFVYLLNCYGANIQILPKEEEIPCINNWTCPGFENVGYGCFYD